MDGKGEYFSVDFTDAKTREVFLGIIYRGEQDINVIQEELARNSCLGGGGITRRHAHELVRSSVTDLKSRWHEERLYEIQERIILDEKGNCRTERTISPDEFYISLMPKAFTYSL